MSLLCNNILTQLGRLYSVFTPYFFAQTFSTNHGYSSSISDYIVSVQGAGSLFGRVLPGMIADKLGAVNTSALMGTCATIVLLSWLTVSGPVGFIVWGFCYGFFSGAFLSLTPACIARFTPNMSQYGGRSGLFFGLISLTAVAAAPSAGALVDQDGGSFDYMIIFSGVGYGVGTLLFWVARFVGSRRLFVKY